jgi:hypothetical protein
VPHGAREFVVTAVPTDARFTAAQRSALERIEAAEYAPEADLAARIRQSIAAGEAEIASGTPLVTLDAALAVIRDQS